jgi:hypothetical protein
MFAALEPVGDNDLDSLLLSLRPEGPVVACWGVHGSYRDRAARVVERIEFFDAPPLKCLGRNKDGTPKHPLYLRKDTKLEDFRRQARCSE